MAERKMSTQCKRPVLESQRHPKVKLMRDCLDENLSPSDRLVNDPELTFTEIIVNGEKRLVEGDYSDHCFDNVRLICLLAVTVDVWGKYQSQVQTFRSICMKR